MHLSSIALAAILPVFAWAAPAPEAGSPTPKAYTPPAYQPPTYAKCKDTVVSAVKKLPKPTSFCSSYLGVKTVTVRKTTTISKAVPVTSTTYAGTFTSTAGSITTALETSTSTIVSTDTQTEISMITTEQPTSTVTFCNGTPVPTPDTPSANPSKRDARLEARIGAKALPSALAKYGPAKVSSACSCLGVPTWTTTLTLTATAFPRSTTVLTLTPTATETVVTATATSTQTITTLETTTTVTTATSISTIVPTTTVESCPAPTACGNQGLGFAIYPNTDGGNPGGSFNPYLNFNPQGYKTRNPDCTGVTNTLGGFNYPQDPTGVTIYGQCERSSSDFFTLNQRGYIFAQQTGTYTFTASDIDDIVELWIGDKAYSGWTRQNADLDLAIFQNYVPFSIDLTAGQYYPVRIVFGQAQGAAKFQMAVTAPDSTEFLGPNSQESPYLVSYSCDESTAPRFPSFGAES